MIELIDEVKTILEAVHIIIMNWPGIDWFYEAHHTRGYQERQDTPDDIRNKLVFFFKSFIALSRSPTITLFGAINDSDFMK